MSKELELIRTLIDGANEYEKKTGNTNPTVYLSKNNLLIIEKALLKAQEDKKKLNEIEKLTHLLYSERRKIGQEYVKWCKENNTVFNDETNMITWVLAIKLKEWLK